MIKELIYKNLGMIIIYSIENFFKIGKKYENDSFNSTKFDRLCFF